MIKNLLKNICLITFALIGPISLPAGGIQKDLNDYKFLDNSKEIILNSNSSLYAFPKNNAKKLSVINTGSSLSILQKWKLNDRDNLWVRVKLANNNLIDNPNKIIKGWIKF